MLRNATGLGGLIISLVELDALAIMLHTSYDTNDLK